jgi:4'-phosphopantetheinyl transferase
MPIVQLHEIDENILVGLWKITETSAFFEEEYHASENYVQSFQTENRRLASVAVRRLVRHLLHHWNLPYFGIIKDTNGKPFLQNHNFSVSLSHAGHYAAAIIHKQKKSGIDIEYIREKLIKVAPRVLSAKELQDAGNHLDKITLYWSAKEALYKNYSERQLIFSENISIAPFEMTTAGKTTGEVCLEGFYQKYCIFYQKIADFVLVYSYETD